MFGIPDLDTLSDKEVEAYEKKVAEQEQQEKAERIKKLFASSGVGTKYLDMTLDDFVADTPEKKTNLENTKEFISEVRGGKSRTMWFCGKNGNGKTMLSAMVVRECGGHFCRSYDIEDELRDSERFQSKESRKDVFKRYKDYPVLVIDEVGRFQSNEELKSLFHILNDRYENNRSTILCTNLDRQSLKNYLGMALVDRFIENCKTVVFSEDSYRITERKNNA